MTQRKLHRLAIAVAMAGSLMGASPALALDPAYSLDINATEALVSFADLTAAGGQQEALELTNYLRYSCIDAIEVDGHAVTLTEIEALIAAPDPAPLDNWANAALAGAPASFVHMNPAAGCQGFDDANTSDTASVQ